MVKNQEATETAVVLGYEVPPSSAKNGLAESRAFIIARQLERDRRSGAGLLSL